MRILWLSMNSGLYQYPGQENGYNGIGWIASLQRLIQKRNDITLGLAFLTNKHLKQQQQNCTLYYPIYTPAPTILQKIKEYYGGYKKIHKEQHLEKIKEIISDFAPDIIHIFGIENPLTSILGETNIPIVIHLQGFLAPYDNAFFPVDFNKTSFMYPFTAREWIMRNGSIYAKKKIHVKGEYEKILFKRVNNVMGRTEWDFQVSKLLAPQSTYYHVNEVLREPFYMQANKWKFNRSKEFTIISTVSETVYKGLDLILKTAYLLTTETNICFTWKVIGINKASKLIHFFERVTGVKSLNCHIQYLGVLDAEKVCQNLLSANAYVHPSYIDNSPNSICEAQLLGLPIIATNVGGISSLIKHGENGLLVPANAPYELTFLLKKLYNNEKFCNMLSEASAKTALQRHDKGTILKDLLKCYDDIIRNTNCH